MALICVGCKKEINFRTIGGKPTPFNCNCGSRNYASYKVVETKTRATSCPKCGDSVFFYRDPSGGSAWFNELGKPWPLHSCMHPTDKIIYVNSPTSKKHSVDQFWIKKIFVPADKSLNPIVEGVDSINCLTIEITGPENSRRLIQLYKDHTFTLEEKSDSQVILRALLGDKDFFAFIGFKHNSQGEFFFT